MGMWCRERKVAGRKEWVWAWWYEACGVKEEYGMYGGMK